MGIERVGFKLHGGPGLNHVYFFRQHCPPFVTDVPNEKHASSQVGIMGSILMTKAVCWVTPSKVMVVRSFEVVAAYVLQVQSKYAEYLRSFDESGRARSGDSFLFR